jgi:hypothetical protein
MVKKFALIIGIVYLLVGIMGFIPPLVTSPEVVGGLAADTGHGRLLGLFPVNLWHNVFHAAIGLWGIFAARDFAAAVGFSKAIAIIYGVLTILGLIPATNMFFGLIPLHGHNIWLHAVTAAVAAYFGFGAPARSIA